MSHANGPEPELPPERPIGYDYPGSARAALESGRTPEGDRPPLVRVLCGGTLYEVRNDPAATYVARAPSWRPVPHGLPGKRVYTAREGEVREGYYPRVPRAPVALLRRIIGLFRESPDREVHVNLLYDRRARGGTRGGAGRYELVSTQVAGSASAGRVSYHHLPHTEERFVVAEIHSHHRMAAYFSETDDESEMRSGVYGVVGRIDRRKPHAAFRYSCGGVFGPLRVPELFAPGAAATELVEEVEPLWAGRNR